MKNDAAVTAEVTAQFDPLGFLRREDPLREFEIDRGVALPANARFLDRCPFKQMLVGDSFAGTREEGNALRTSVFYWKLSHPDQNFTVRKFAGGYRVWRIK